MYKDKNLLRRELIALRKNISDKHEREQAATRIALSLLRGNVLVYVSMGSELSTDKLIAELLKRSDGAAFAPYTANGVITPKRLAHTGKPDSNGNLPNDCYGETCDTKIDFCVTPLLGFNGDGYRIGYGKGCYDRFFRADLCGGVRVGLAFDCQRVEFVNEKHDEPLDCCITESGVIYFNNASNIG